MHGSLCAVSVTGGPVVVPHPLGKIASKRTEPAKVDVPNNRTRFIIDISSIA